jgi:hypothetical protein
MATYAQLAARMLRDAATFFRKLAEQNEALKEQLNDNAAVYEQVADQLHRDPNAEIGRGDVGEPGTET